MICLADFPAKAPKKWDNPSFLGHLPIETSRYFHDFPTKKNMVKPSASLPRVERWRLGGIRGLSLWHLRGHGTPW